MSTSTQIDTREIANTIRQQITAGVLMSLGAHDIGAARMAHEQGGPMLPSLVFKALILPFNKNGERSERPRKMYVIVSLTPADTYKITVTYNANVGNGRGPDRTDHYHATDVYAEDLSRTLLALDYDGDTVLNPRYI